MRPASFKPRFSSPARAPISFAASSTGFGVRRVVGPQFGLHNPCGHQGSDDGDQECADEHEIVVGRGQNLIGSSRCIGSVDDLGGLGRDTGKQGVHGSNQDIRRVSARYPGKGSCEDPQEGSARPNERPRLPGESGPYIPFPRLYSRQQPQRRRLRSVDSGALQTRGRESPLPAIPNVPLRRPRGAPRERFRAAQRR